MTLSMAEEANAISAGDNRACSDGRIERTNVVVVRGQGQGVGVPPRRDPYAMEVDRGRNCYACGGFGHMAHHCKNRRRGKPMEGRKVEYRGGRIEEINEHSNNLKGVENLELLD